MKASRIIAAKGASALASVVKFTAKQSNSTTCVMVFHQPNVPAKVLSLKK